MCYHYSQAYRLKKIAEKYNSKVNPVEEWFPEYHIKGFDSPPVPIINMENKVEIAQWGLIPSWVKTEDQANEIKFKTLNARTETVTEKPSFQAIESKRCIIPASGFFEWKHTETGKQPYYIYPKEEEMFSFAGMFDVWMNRSTGEQVKTCSILTTSANELMEDIHNVKKRMPLILKEDKVNQWLSEDAFKHWNELIKPVETDFMQAHTISNLITKKGFNTNTPDILKKVAVHQQQRLF